MSATDVLQHKAFLLPPQYVGATPLVNLCGINAFFQKGVLLALLEAGADPNQIQLPRTKLWGFVVRLCRAAHRIQGEAAPDVVMRLAISHGGSALHSAAQAGNVTATSVLLAHGGDGTIRDRRGWAPADYAEGRGVKTLGPFPEVVKALQAHSSLSC